MAGHAELVTGLKFTPDGRRLVSVGGDGCIFVWKLNSTITESINDRMREIKAQEEARKKKLAQLASKPQATEGEKKGDGDSDVNVEDSRVEDEWKLSTPVPAWAKTAAGQTVRGDDLEGMEVSEEPPEEAQNQGVRGKWASRVSQEGYEVLGKYKVLPDAGVQETLHGVGEGLDDSRLDDPDLPVVSVALPSGSLAFFGLKYSHLFGSGREHAGCFDVPRSQPIIDSPHPSR